MNNNNLIDLISQTKNYQAHRKKIASIMTKNQASDPRRMGNINSFYSNHDRAKSYNFKAKQDAVEKQNDLILKKIIQVNNRKSSNQMSQRNSSHNNLLNLKKSMDTINFENQKLAQKLVSTTSNLKQEKLVNSYQKHLQRKQMIKKYEYDEEVGLVVPKKMKSLQKIKTTLQPIRYRQTQRYGYQSRRTIQENQEDK